MIKNGSVNIKGAGIAGLTSAIILAQKGLRVNVYEKCAAVGGRRYGDSQGLENWTEDEDVLHYLRRLGIKTDFWFKPINEVTFFSYDNQSFTCQTDRPLLYMIKRGSTAGCLDFSLKNQALDKGVKIFYGKKVDNPLDVDSSGAKKAAAFAHGVTFDTNAPDMVTAIVDDRLAPKYYSYFIALEGRATLVSGCFGKPFSGSKKYYHATLQRYKELLNFDIKNPREFGKIISFSFIRPRDVIAIGEAGGIQDSLFGFGMRLAIRSAELAAISITDGRDYYGMYKKNILPYLKAGLVNRFLYERLGNAGYKQQLIKILAAKDARKFFRQGYKFTLIHRVFYPFARLKFRKVNEGF